jgi:hypothetical protein
VFFFFGVSLGEHLMAISSSCGIAQKSDWKLFGEDPEIRSKLAA